MPCYHPLHGWRAKQPNESGKYPVVFKSNEGSQDEPLKLPCGRCIGCRLESSRQWATRCMHESQLHENNCFITLTYNDENLPHGESLQKEDWQNFMKRLRHRASPQKIRFFMCGEYGENKDVRTISPLGRPHYHAIIFGFDFPDKKLVSESEEGHPYFYSSLLEDTWGKGFAQVANFSFDTAAYVARYCLKKINGDEADDHYTRTNTTTGELTYIHPEFTLSSRRPGIAGDWFHKYETDLHKGYITVNGIKCRPPKYYDRLMETFNEYDYEFIKEKRALSIDPDDPEYHSVRLAVKEELRKHKINRNLKRTQL